MTQVVYDQIIMKTDYYKKMAMQVMIYSLVTAAAIAVVAVLIGSLNEVLLKALWTLALVTLHALVSLSYAQSREKTRGALTFFNNSVFAIIILSFLTSVFGVWEVLPGDIIAKLYGTYFVLLFASLHGSLLEDSVGKESRIDTLVRVNYIFMIIVIAMLLPLIWIGTDAFGDMYVRILAASGIIDATLTIMVAIYTRMYIQKNPEASVSLYAPVAYDAQGNPIAISNQKRRIHPLIWILGIFIFGQFFIGLLFAIFGLLFSFS